MATAPKSRSSTRRRQAGIAIVLAAGLQPMAGHASDIARTPVATPMQLQACSAAPGYVIPGLDACLRLGGTVEVEAATRFAEPAFVLSGKPGRPMGLAAHAAPLSSIGARAVLRADVRTQTDYGPLRVYVSIRAPRGLSAHDAGGAEPR